MEERFWEAAKNGDAKEEEAILREVPTVDVNWGNELSFSWTALHVAAEKGHSAIVSMLLVHPNINVNAEDRDGNTPFLAACFGGYTSCVRLLLKDPRVKVNEPNEGGYTALSWATQKGHLDVIKWIASEREMDLVSPDVLAVAREENQAEVVTLLERFQENPVETTHAVRVELGCLEELAAEIFALVVFISDGLLQVGGGDQSTTPTGRFFSMGRRLPLELQMILCYRAVGSAKEMILAMASEAAFRNLAERI